MQVCDVLDPAIDLGGVSLGVLDRAHYDVTVLQLLTLGTQLQLQHGGVRLVG